MTVIAVASLSHRRTAPAGHAYTVPVVRELPAQPVDLRDSSTW